MSDPYTVAILALRRARRVAVLTGAGVSAESGIPTFRASDGLWEGHHIEDVASPEGYRRNPTMVWEFYNARRKSAANCKPNPGHYALAALEARYGDGFTLATQNVDGYHQLAGSKNVLELHGSLRRTRCPDCGDIADAGLRELSNTPTCEKCNGPVRPDIVWFGEMLPTTVLAEGQRAAAQCDVFLIVGTSAVVWPAAGLAPLAKAGGATVIEVNLAKSAVADSVDVGLYGPSGEVLPKLVAMLKE